MVKKLKVQIEIDAEWFDIKCLEQILKDRFYSTTNPYTIKVKENIIWLAVDKNGRAHLFRTKPYRDGEQWRCYSTKEIPFPVLPVDLYSISMWLNITEDKLKWENEPIEI